MIAGTIAGTNNPDLDAERFIQEEGWENALLPAVHILWQVIVTPTCYTARTRQALAVLQRAKILGVQIDVPCSNASSNVLANQGGWISRVGQMTHETAPFGERDQGSKEVTRDSGDS